MDAVVGSLPYGLAGTLTIKATMADQSDTFQGGTITNTATATPGEHTHRVVRQSRIAIGSYGRD
jgi:hypothetical protein